MDDLKIFFEWLKAKRGSAQAAIEIYYLTGGLASLFASDEEIIARVHESAIYKAWTELGSPSAEEWKAAQGSEQEVQEAIDLYKQQGWLPADQYDDPLSIIHPNKGMEWVKEDYAPDGTYIPGGVWYQSPIAEVPFEGTKYIPAGSLYPEYPGLIQNPDGTWIDTFGHVVTEERAQKELDAYYTSLGGQPPSALEEAQTAYYQAQTENLSKQWTELTAAEKEKFYNDQQYFEFQKQQWAEQFGLEEAKFGFTKEQWAEQLAQQQFEFGNLSAYQQAQLEIMMKPWEQMTFYEQAQFDFSKEQFEWQKQQWEQEFAQQQYEFGNLSAWQQAQLGLEQQQFGGLSAWQQAQLGLEQQQFGGLSAWQQAQMGLSQQELALQEKMYGAQLQERPMDWISAYFYAKAPGISNIPIGTPNPQAPNQPYIPYEQIGVV